MTFLRHPDSSSGNRFFCYLDDYPNLLPKQKRLSGTKNYLRNIKKVSYTEGSFFCHSKRIPLVYFHKKYS
jgi:hypothetical protein